MNYGVSVTDTSKVKEIEKSGLFLIKKLEQFSSSLKEITSFQLPRGIIFHDLTSATQLYSTIPLPAYTSRDLIHITPLVETWKDIYTSTTNGVVEAENYYSELDINDVAIIAAHELTHHASFFHSEFEEIDEKNVWFEEGLCFYIPRKLILCEEKFKAIMNVESKLINKYKEKYGEYTLNMFGKSANQNEDFEYSSAFYDYWRSTIVVDLLVKNHCNNSVLKLIDHYKEWANSDKRNNLQEYFINNFQLSNDEAKMLWLSN